MSKSVFLKIAAFSLTITSSSIASATPRLLPVTQNGKWSLIDTEGNLVKPLNYDRSGFAGELVFVATKISDSKFKVQYVDPETNEITLSIEQPADNITGEPRTFEFSKGLAAAQKRTEFYSHCGYINKKGVWIVEPQFLQCKKFGSHFAEVVMAYSKGHALRGAISPGGLFVVSPIFSSVNISDDFVSARGWLSEDRVFSEQTLKFRSLRVKSLDGNQFEEIYIGGLLGKELLWLCTREKICGWVKRIASPSYVMEPLELDWLAPPQFEGVLEFPKWISDVDSQLPIAVKLADGWTFADRAGKILTTERFKRVTPFSNDRASLAQGMSYEWFIVDSMMKSKKIKLPNAIEVIHPFNEGIALIQWRHDLSQGRTAMVNLEGQTLDFDGISPSKFREGILVLNQLASAQAYNRGGRPLFRFSPEKIEWVSDDLDILKVSRKGEFAYYRASSQSWIWPLSPAALE